MASLLARETAAQAWCTKKNEKKIMDPELAEAFADILDKETNIPRLGCATTKEMLEEITARIKMSGELDYRTVDN
jgi:hypothetical protein